MKKKNIILFLIILSLGFGFFFFINPKDKGSEKDASVILYVSTTCPHCQKVEDWLDQNSQVKEKSGLVEKEVSYNKTNSQDMADKAKECQLDASQGLFVPMLYDQGRCLVGDEPIINYLSEAYR